MAVRVCERCGEIFRARLWMQRFCDNCTYDLLEARSKGVERCVREMVCVRCEHEPRCSCGCRCACHKF